MRAWVIAVTVLLTATSALAHHSNSAFDPEKVVVLKGTVVQWLWTNPHVWIHLAVDDGSGGKTEWQIEGRPPGVLARSGWSRTIFKPGDTITVDFSPARDGSHTGLATRVTLADGTVLSQATPQ
jgi:plastocyanin